MDACGLILFFLFPKVLVTDGLTSVMSEQEIVDIVRRAKVSRGVV